MHIAGVDIGSDKFSLVILDTLDKGVFALLTHRTLKLTQEARPKAYRTLADQFLAAIENQGIERLYFNCSIASRFSGLGHLHTAELRGVLQVTVRTLTVIPVNNSTVSRCFGERKTAEYLKDDTFWNQKVNGSLPKGMREAAFIAIAGHTA